MSKQQAISRAHLLSLAKLMSRSDQAHTFSTQLVTLDPFGKTKNQVAGQPILENLLVNISRFGQPLNPFLRQIEEVLPDSCK